MISSSNHAAVITIRALVGVKVGAPLIISEHDKCVLPVYRVYVIVAG